MNKCNQCKKEITKGSVYCAECFKGKPRSPKGSGKFLPCENCGKIIYRAVYRIKRAKYLVCSKECEAKIRIGKLAGNWQGGDKERARKLGLIRQRKYNKKNKLTAYLRKRIWEALRNNYKSAHTLELLGCSVKFLKLWLQLQFKDGMSWSNYGKWHVDHIRPCASFDMSNSEHQKACFNYTNLQPLWAKDNLEKSAKYKD